MQWNTLKINVLRWNSGKVIKEIVSYFLLIILFLRWKENKRVQYLISEKWNNWKISKNDCWKAQSIGIFYRICCIQLLHTYSNWKQNYFSRFQPKIVKVEFLLCFSAGKSETGTTVIFIFGRLPTPTSSPWYMFFASHKTCSKRPLTKIEKPLGLWSSP